MKTKAPRGTTKWTRTDEDKEKDNKMDTDEGTKRDNKMDKDR